MLDIGPKMRLVLLFYLELWAENEAFLNKFRIICGINILPQGFFINLMFFIIINILRVTIKL